MAMMLLKRKDCPEACSLYCVITGLKLVTRVSHQQVNFIINTRFAAWLLQLRLHSKESDAAEQVAYK